VATEGAAGETGQLVTDINEMITRLEALVTSQQRFIAYASHELRSPLSVLYGELSLALRKPRDAAEYREAIQAALESTRQLKQLAEDLLTLARVANTYRDTARLLSVPELLQAASRKVAPPQREAEWLATDLADCEVRGVDLDLTRLFVNLLENALRYTPAGKHVYVRARAQEDRVRVWIADEGPGIAASERERVFEPFYRGERDQGSSEGGAGLGLTIVREIARTHGGSVRVADAAERDPAWGREGACFVVELPRGRGELARALSA
jgi:two-component system heavy metal sensor histidine kinase CusS